MGRQTENRLMDMGRGEDRMRCMERVTWKLTLPYVKQIQQEFAVCPRKLKQDLCINLEGWQGQEMGGRFKREWIYIYI